MTAEVSGLTAAELVSLLPDYLDSPLQIWACERLGLDGEEDWWEGRVLSRQFARYDLGSVLVALESLPDVAERARFGDGGREPVRHRDVATGWGQTRRCATADTYVAIEVSGVPAIVWLEGGATAEVAVYAVSPEEATIDRALDMVSDLVAGRASTWRGQAVLISPSEQVLFQHLPPDDVDGLVLADELDAELSTNLVTPVRHFDELSELVPRRGVLLYGPPGTGKTSAARVVRLRCDGHATVLVATPKALVHPEMVRLMFQMAGEAAPSVVVIEDLDVTIGERNSSRAPEALGEILAQLDGPGRRSGVFTLATTNHIEALDAALSRRPGRFDRRVFVGPAAASVRRQTVEAIAARLEPACDLDALVAATDGWTLAEVAELERLTVLRAHTADQPADLLASVPDVHRGAAREPVEADEAPVGVYL